MGIISKELPPPPRGILITSFLWKVEYVVDVLLVPVDVDVDRRRLEVLRGRVKDSDPLLLDNKINKTIVKERVFIGFVSLLFLLAFISIILCLFVSFSDISKKRKD